MGYTTCNKMAEFNSRFATVSEEEIVEIEEKAIPENTKKATKFGIKVFQGKNTIFSQTNTVKMMKYSVSKLNLCVCCHECF